jgi:hypothetical protein
MRSLAWALLIGASLAASSAKQPAPRVVDVSTSAELVAALNGKLDNVTVNLAPGTYRLTPTRRLVRPLSQMPRVIRTGHEEDSVWVTMGAVVSGRSVTLQGSLEGEAVISTGAGYGIYFENCKDCAVDRVTITGGVIDSVERSGDAAVVVRESSVRVSNCVITDDYTASGTEVGIAGICVRESGVLTAEYNEIDVRSAAGVAIYDGGVTVIQNNAIKGGVLLSGKYRAVIQKNLITQAGCGVSANGGSVEIRSNIVENISVVAINLFFPRDAVVDRNAIFDCGGSGIFAGAYRDSTDQVRVTGNLIVATGKGKDLAGFAAPLLLSEAGTELQPNSRASIHWSTERNNTCYANHASVDSLDRDVSREAFWRARRPWTRTYRNTAVGVDGRHKFYESAFLTRYGRWAD